MPLAAKSKTEILAGNLRRRAAVDEGLLAYVAEYGVVTALAFRRQRPDLASHTFFNRRLQALAATGVLRRLSYAVYRDPARPLPTYYQVGMAYDPDIVALFFKAGSITPQSAKPILGGPEQVFLFGGGEQDHRAFTTRYLHAQVAHLLKFSTFYARVRSLMELGVLSDFPSHRMKRLHPNIFLPFDPTWQSSRKMYATLDGANAPGRMPNNMPRQLREAFKESVMAPLAPAPTHSAPVPVPVPQKILLPDDFWS